MGTALDTSEVALLHASHAEAALGARLAAEAVAAAKRCVGGVEAPVPPQWRFLLAKALLNRGDVRPARKILRELVNDATVDANLSEAAALKLFARWFCDALYGASASTPRKVSGTGPRLFEFRSPPRRYETWLKLANWTGVDESTSKLRQTMAFRDETNEGALAELRDKFGRYDDHLAAVEEEKRARKDEIAKAEADARKLKDEEPEHLRSERQRSSRARTPQRDITRRNDVSLGAGTNRSTSG